MNEQLSPLGARAIAALVLLCGLLLSSGGRAAEVGPDGSLLAAEVHAFGSQGFILTLHNDYLADHTTKGSFEFSEVGFNVSKRLTDSFSMGLQLFAQNLGPSGNFTPIVDWFYLDYRRWDWLGLRVGRLKIPYGLFNDIQDVDSARVPVLLPQSVYPLQTREILFAQTGAELYGFVRLPSLGALDYRLFGGTIFIDEDKLRPAGSTVDVDIRVPYVAGGRLLWETPLEGLRAGGSIETVRLDTTAFVPGIAPFLIKNRSWLWVASLDYAVSDLRLTAEYSRWFTRQRSDAPTLSPAIKSLSERAYAMVTYRLTSWFEPGAYYSMYFPNVHDRRGRENRQHDVAVTFRFDVNEHWLVKLEGHYMDGTAGLLNPLRLSTQDITTADKYWGAFFVKTTAHF
jgi:hypothetical protein